MTKSFITKMESVMTTDPVISKSRPYLNTRRCTVQALKRAIKEQEDSRLEDGIDMSEWPEDIRVREYPK